MTTTTTDSGTAAALTTVLSEAHAQVCRSCGERAAVRVQPQAVLNQAAPAFPVWFCFECGHEERAVYALEGDVTVAGTPLPPQHMAVLARREPVEVKALTRARLMLIGGEKADGERLIWWNFVASSRELLEEAKVRWREQRFERVPGDDEFIPLPEE